MSLNSFDHRVSKPGGQIAKLLSSYSNLYYKCAVSCERNTYFDSLTKTFVESPTQQKINN